MAWTFATKNMANTYSSQIEGVHFVRQGLLDYIFGMLHFDICQVTKYIQGGLRHSMVLSTHFKETMVLPRNHWDKINMVDKSTMFFVQEI